MFRNKKQETANAKQEADRAKQSQLVDAHGMEVSSVYFRRLLASNASLIFPNAPRSTADGGASYPLLVNEMQKLTRNPQQAYKIADALDTSEGDVFRDFDLSTFMDHFRLDPVAKTTLALACRTVSKQDIRTKCKFVFIIAVDLHSLVTHCPTAVIYFPSSRSLFAPYISPPSLIIVFIVIVIQAVIQAAIQSTIVIASTFPSCTHLRDARLLSHEHALPACSVPRRRVLT